DRYDSTILHVVWEYDTDVQRCDGTVLPTVQLKDRVNQAMIDKYLKLMNNMNQIPCEKQLDGKVDNITRTLWMERMLIERLEHKSEYLKALLCEDTDHWQRTLLIMLGRAFGMSVNTSAFETLTKAVDFSLLLKYHTEPVK